jgi:hypothetical protein
VKCVLFEDTPTNKFQNFYAKTILVKKLKCHSSETEISNS